jgi:hypothetical protein
MPNRTAANGVKHSTSIATNEFLVAPQSDKISRVIWRKLYSLRRAILRKFEVSQYRYDRRAEIARCKTTMRPSFVFTTQH